MKKRTTDAQITEVVERMAAVLLALGARLGMTAMDVCLMVNQEEVPPRQEPRS